MCKQEYGNDKILAVACDVAVESEAKRLIEEAVKAFGAIDVLVLAAGISAHSTFENFHDMDIFKKVVDVNLYSCVFPTKYALRHLKQSNRSKAKPKGHIVVFSSYSGEFGLPFRSAYCASKFAVNGFFESLRMEIGD